MARPPAAIRRWWLSPSLWHKSHEGACRSDVERWFPIGGRQQQAPLQIQTVTFKRVMRARASRSTARASSPSRAIQPYSAGSPMPKREAGSGPPVTGSTSGGSPAPPLTGV
jgi:hypothetical protein